MPVALPKLHVGNPLRHESLSVFPIFAESHGEVEYRLSDEALAERSLVVEEVSESGSVPELLVENKGDSRVLFLEGEQLIGAKQNRILNTSVLVGAHTRIKIPVSCVEQGRWRYRNRNFSSSRSHSPSKLRHALKSSVSRSLRARRGHTSDQGEVWREVARQQLELCAVSDSSAMSDTFDQYQEPLAAFRDHLKYVEGATGLAVALGKKVVALDIFDKPATCRKVWDRLLSGLALEAIEQREAENEAADIADVEQWISTTPSLRWEQAEAVGEGEEYRAESESGDHASALVFDGSVLHESVVVEC